MTLAESQTVDYVRGAPDYALTMISDTIRDLPFKGNQPLKSADD